MLALRAPPPGTPGVGLRPSGVPTTGSGVDRGARSTLRVTAFRRERERKRESNKGYVQLHVVTAWAALCGGRSESLAEGRLTRRVGGWAARCAYDFVKSAIDGRRGSDEDLSCGLHEIVRPSDVLICWGGVNLFDRILERERREKATRRVKGARGRVFSIRSRDCRHDRARSDFEPKRGQIGH